MNTKEFVSMAELELGKAFPDYVIRLFPDPDDDATFFAYTFGVPDEMESEAKRSVRAYIRTHLDGYEWDVIPSIKNLTVTREHYPQYLRCDESGFPVPNAIIFNVVQASRHDQNYADDFRVDDFDQMLVDHCTCTMPNHRESHEGRFDIAA